METISDLESVNILRAQYLDYKLLNKFFNLTADLLCIADFDGYFKKINPAVSKLLGYTEEELFARPINSFVYGMDKKDTSRGRNDVYQGVPLLDFENRYVTKSGEIVWLSWTSIPDLEKEVVFAIAKDVTRRKRQEEERDLLISDLKKINQDLKQFTRMASHDMRSPVNNLINIFSLLDISKITDPETIELVNLLKVTSNNLNETVNNFMDVLIKSDGLNISIVELDLMTSLNIVKNSISSLISDSGATIISDFSAFNNLFFNKTYLESIFLNLITNSIKYAHPKRQPVIKISALISNDVKQLVISDNGLGIDLIAAKDKIFGLYQVFHDRPDSKGIGLHLVYKHVTSLRGQISVESTVNEGTTFTISFK